ncbi:hypothetical protein ACFLSI_02340 [Bacteroidota bacterium]
MDIRKITWIISILFIFNIGTFASVEVIGSLKRTHKGAQGDVFKGEIQIQNSDDTKQEVRIYQTDLLYNFEGLTFYDENETHSRSNKNWISFSPKTVILNAHESRFIQYEITIPNADSIVGTFWSVLMVEGVDPIDPTQEGELNIRTLTRYAIQIVSETTDLGTGLLKFLKPTIITEEDKLFLAIDLVNEGQHYISPEVSMEIFDENGESVKTIKAPKKGIFPTTSARFRLDLEGLKAEQTYKCLIIAAGEEEDVFGLEYTLYF